jgi:recombination protein RecA
MGKREIDAVVRRVNKKYSRDGRPAVIPASEVPPVEKVPSSSPSLNHVLTGGWPRGKLVEVFGQESSGKTTLMLLALRDLWEAEGRRRAIAMINVERRFDKDWARKLGLPVDSPHEMFIAPPVDAEEQTDVMVELIRSGSFCAVGFDSIGGAIPARLQDPFADQATLMGGVAAVMSRNVRVVAPAADDAKCTVIYVNQLRADMEGYRRPITPGGHAVKHMNSVRLYVRKGRDEYTSGDYGKSAEGKPTVVGYLMRFKVVKNTFGPPFREGASDFYFLPSSEWLPHVGFDVEKDIAALGMLAGIVEQRGAWYEWDGVRGQGRDKFFAALREAGRLPELEKAVAEWAASPTAARAPDDLPDAPGPDVSDPEV